MRGYLQRMAGSTLSRERAIHPSVGSLWAPQLKTDSFEESGETFVSSITSQPVEKRIQNPLQMQDRPTHLQAESLEVADEQASQFTPLIEAKAMMPGQHPPKTQLSTIHAMPSTLPQSGDTGELKVAESEPQSYSFSPLVAKFSQSGAVDQRSTALSAAPQHVDSLRSQFLAQPAHEPDSIEIHIGRIEVLAAQPQPSPRPTAQPVKKSLDLGEYLRRGGRVQ
jgi:hypothetical protein